MTDRDWPTATDPTAMLRLVADRISDRKLRLFLVGCCRRLWPVFGSHLRHTVECAELYADGRRSEVRLANAWRQAEVEYLRAIRTPYDAPDLLPEATSRQFLIEDGRVGSITVPRCLPALVGVAADPDGYDRWRRHARAADRRPPLELEEWLEQSAVAVGVRAAKTDGGGTGQRDAVAALERAAQVDLLRCIVGDPLTVTVPDPRWLTDAVIGLARRVYDRRDFAVLPILADALEEAGCEDAELLAHCRHGREHARGCWAVDLLLGKG